MFLAGRGGAACGTAVLIEIPQMSDDGINMQVLFIFVVYIVCVFVCGVRARTFFFLACVYMYIYNYLYIGMCI